MPPLHWSPAFLHLKIVLVYRLGIGTNRKFVPNLKSKRFYSFFKCWKIHDQDFVKGGQEFEKVGKEMKKVDKELETL